MSIAAELPPGPRAPRAWQTLAWIAQPAGFLQRCARRHGDPFTLRTHWADAPMVLVSDPAEVRRVFTAPELRAAGSGLLAPFAGPTSILVVEDREHLRQRRLMLPPFQGDRMSAYQPLVAELAGREVDSWRPGRLQALPRMQALTLEVILRVVFGDDRPELRSAVRRALDLTSALPRLVAMTVTGRDAAFRRAVEEVDALLYRLVGERRSGGSGAVVDALLAARHDDGSPPSDQEVRDQLVTLLAAGHETTATSLAWAVERLARHPDVPLHDDAALGAVVKETLRVRPVLTIAPRLAAQPYRIGRHTLPPGTHVAAAIALTHRRPELYPEPAAFRPERWLDGAPDASYAWIPFGGGVRRCLGAAFAAMEMREVLRAIAQRGVVRADPRRPEAARRRGVTLSPARGATVRWVRHSAGA